MAKTKEEKFLLKIYEMTDQGQKNIDIYEAGYAIGCNYKAITNMIRILQRSNFIKKIDDTTFALTKNGIELVQTMTA